MTSIFTAFFITPRFELNLRYFIDNYNLKIDSLSWLLTYQSDTRQVWSQRQSPTIKKMAMPGYQMFTVLVMHWWCIRKKKLTFTWLSIIQPFFRKIQNRKYLTREGILSCRDADHHLSKMFKLRYILIGSHHAMPSPILNPSPSIPSNLTLCINFYYY